MDEKKRKERDEYFKEGLEALDKDLQTQGLGKVKDWITIRMESSDATYVPQILIAISDKGHLASKGGFDHEEDKFSDSEMSFAQRVFKTIFREDSKKKSSLFFGVHKHMVLLHLLGKRVVDEIDEDMPEILLQAKKLAGMGELGEGLLNMLLDSSSGAFSQSRKEVDENTGEVLREDEVTGEDRVPDMPPGIASILPLLLSGALGGRGDEEGFKEFLKGQLDTVKKEAIDGAYEKLNQKFEGVTLEYGVVQLLIETLHDEAVMGDNETQALEVLKRLEKDKPAMEYLSTMDASDEAAMRTFVDGLIV